VTATTLDCWSDSNRQAVREQLGRILHSGPFAHSRRRQRFLEYIVNEALAGRGEQLKGYTVGIEVFDRPEAFDPAIDPIVRIEAARVREKLREYYDTDGLSDPVRIDLPKGTYTPQIEFRAATDEPQTNGLPAKGRAHAPAWVLVAVIAGAVLLLIAGYAAWRSLAFNPQDKASIAVLPFQNLGDDVKWDRFADGLTEDIITDLSHNKDVFIVARSSTEVYKNKPTDIRSIGRDLGVRYVLEGSIQPSGNRIRVTAQLINAETGRHVWSNRYERPVTDLFEVQSDVTGSIAATLTGYEGAVASAERSLIRRKPPMDLNAYEIYLLAMEAKHGGAAGGVTKEGLEEAERLFHKSLEIDPQLARAYVGLAYIYEYRLDFGIASVAENMQRQMEAARNAVRLDPNDGEAQLVLGHAYAYAGLTDQALEQFDKAEALAPNNADVLILIAWYLPQLGQPERAVLLAEKALKLNPNYSAWYNQGLRYVYFFGRRFDKSLKYAKLVTDKFALDFAYQAAASAMMGDMAGARSASAEVIRLDPNWSVEQYLSANGGYPDDAAMLFVEGAKKAGIKACAPASEVSSTPNFVHIKTCDEERSQQPTG
jgi:TolB-like protein/Tfp pilus assembly protein PilF